MKEAKSLAVLILVALTIPGLSANPAIAEPMDSPSASTNKLSPELASPPPAFEASLSSSYLLPSQVRVGGVKLGRSDGVELGFNARGGTPIDENWTWSWGVRSENLFLGSVAGAPVPDRINTLHLDTGAGYKWNERWMIRGFVGPTLYRFDHVGSGTIGFSGGAFATYQASPAWTWNFGILVTPDSDVKALPVLGLTWRINDLFTLELGIPRTRLSYKVDTKWTLYTGLDMVGTTFRTGETFGTSIGAPQHNDALATYRDVRLGAGVGYEITHGIRAEIEAGGSVYRRIKYTGIDEEVKFSPAPYIGARMSAAF